MRKHARKMRSHRETPRPPGDRERETLVGLGGRAAGHSIPSAVGRERFVSDQSDPAAVREFLTSRVSFQRCNIVLESSLMVRKQRRWSPRKEVRFVLRPFLTELRVLQSSTAGPWHASYASYCVTLDMPSLLLYLER